MNADSQYVDTFVAGCALTEQAYTYELHSLVFQTCVSSAQMCGLIPQLKVNLIAISEL